MAPSIGAMSAACRIAPKDVKRRDVPRPDACATEQTASPFPARVLVGGRGEVTETLAMLYTIAIVLVVLWLLGLVTSFTMGGLLHILLVVAVIMIVVQLIQGRRV